MKDIERLQKELQLISHRIYYLKQVIENAPDYDSSQLKQLRKELKNLQWQALFYIEKIENLK